MWRKFTLVVVPPPDRPAWRMSMTTRMAAFLGLSWGLLTLWAGLLAGSRVDYWAAKAEVRLMEAKVEGLSIEADTSRQELARFREAELKLRAQLKMPAEEPAGAPAKPASGGPEPQDRAELASQLMTAVSEESRRRLAGIEQIGSFLEKRRLRERSTPLGWPAPGRLTSRFGYRASPLHRSDEETDEFHAGLDIANGLGTPILATADGVVGRAGPAGGYGRMILIRHDHGFHTLFGHTSKILVRVGQQVKRGQIIAAMGSTGRSTGSHVHYEIWLKGRPVDPRRYLKSAVAP